jgi:hypothetical protein
MINSLFPACAALTCETFALDVRMKCSAGAGDLCAPPDGKLSTPMEELRTHVTLVEPLVLDWGGGAGAFR